MDKIDFRDIPSKSKAPLCSPAGEPDESFKILVIDKKPSTSKLISTALEEYYFSRKPVSIFTADDLMQAEEYLAANPDIIIVFLGVCIEGPNIDINVIKRLRSNHICQIILITNASNRRSYELIQTWGIDDYIAEQDIDDHQVKKLVSSSIKNFLDKKEIHNKLEAKHEIEKSLKEQELILKDVIKNIGDILWETNLDLEYIYISRKVEPLTGYKRSDFIERKFTDFLTLESKLNTWPSLLEKILSRQKFSNIEISRKTSTGDIQYYLISGNPVYDGNGQYHGYRGADIDITDLKNAHFAKERLEAQLRHSQKLEAVGTLAGGIAHDFNNILGGILGYAQLIQLELTNNPTSISYTKEIVSGCHRAKNLITQILDFSRRDEETEGQLIANPIEIINETIKLLRASLPSSIEITPQIDKSTGCIKADPSQVHQAVMNLCTNAKQAISNGVGQLHIALKEQTHSKEHPIKDLTCDLSYGDYICICVTDTGSGIKPALLDKIFNPYFTTKPKGEGTGLGLSVVHGIVTRFKGAIIPKSSPGEGSVFSLYFPKYTNENNSIKRKPKKLVKGNANILFVDDEPMLVNLGRIMLTKLGYKAYTTQSPINALEMVEQSPDKFDLVITDLTMPEIHGPELAEKIKAANNKIPIILITGFANQSSPLSRRTEHIDAVMPKPIEINALSKTINKIMNSNNL